MAGVVSELHTVLEAKVIWFSGLPVCEVCDRVSRGGPEPLAFNENVIPSQSEALIRVLIQYPSQEIILLSGVDFWQESAQTSTDTFSVGPGLWFSGICVTVVSELHGESPAT